MATAVEEFTHILDIKIIHNSDSNIVKNKDLLKQVKRYFINYEHSQTIKLNNKDSDVVLSWKRKRWDFPYNKFIGDLVLVSPYNTDLVIYDHTTKTISCILEDLREKRNYWNDFDIIFNISKPLR